jgi:hemolysin-activating ACP:hemolysin acyltransferase
MTSKDQKVAHQLSVVLNQIIPFLKGKNFKIYCHGQETHKPITAAKT